MPAETPSDGEEPPMPERRKAGLAALLKSWTPMVERLPETDDPPLPPEDIFG